MQLRLAFPIRFTLAHATRLAAARTTQRALHTAAPAAAAPSASARAVRPAALSSLTALSRPLRQSKLPLTGLRRWFTTAAAADNSLSHLMSQAAADSVASSADSAPVVPFKVRLYFVRHGESQMNTRAHLLGGQHNHVALTTKGEQQAALLGTRLAFDKIKFDAVYTSTAVRAMETADIALRVSGLTGAAPIEHTDALLEQAQGEWEGKERKDVYTAQVHQDMLDLHMDFCAPGGESLRHVQERAIEFLDPKIEQWKCVSVKEGREVVLGIFGHGGCIRVMLHHFVGVHDPLTWLLQQENTTLNELLIDPRGVSTIRVNDDAHLKYTMASPPTPPETHAKL